MNWDNYIDYEDMKNLAISIGIFLLFLLFRKLFSRYVFSLLLKFSDKIHNDMLTHIFVSFEKAIRGLFIIAGVYVAADFYPYMDKNNPLFMDIIRSSVIIMITWGLYTLVSVSSVVFFKVKKRYNLEIDDILIPFLSRALRIIIVAISITIVAQEFDYDVNGFVAGLGLGGVAVALAAKDAISNLFGGFIIITEKPFTIGDWIETPSVEGTVEDINFRSTLVRRFDQALVTVPNATLASEAITNWSKMGKRQVSFNLRVAYDTPIEKLRVVASRIEELIETNPDVHPETIFIKFDDYKDTGYELFIYFFTKTTVWGDYLKTKEQVNFGILEILNQEGVSLAFNKLSLESN